MRVTLLYYSLIVISNVFGMFLSYKCLDDINKAFVDAHPSSCLLVKHISVIVDLVLIILSNIVNINSNIKGGAIPRSENWEPAKTRSDSYCKAINYLANKHTLPVEMISFKIGKVLDWKSMQYAYLFLDDSLFIDLDLACKKFHHHVNNKWCLEKVGN